ncbi:MAG TPA: hypothetical protein VMV71_00995 [Candidatus Paceibacterota bacterium]|nr:hypothetical protein [Candidatus Paceibacterota bacterium]
MFNISKGKEDVHDHFRKLLLSCLQKRTGFSKTVFINEAARLGISKNKFLTDFARLFEDAAKRISLLWVGHPESWAMLLFDARGTEYFEDFKILSPFWGNVIIAMECLNDSAHFFGDTTCFGNVAWITDKIRSALNSKDWVLTQKDKYIVIFDKAGQEAIHEFWIGSEDPEVHGPRHDQRP